MNRTLSIPVIVLIAVVMVVGIVSPAMAKEGNNGNNGCEKSGNAKACENNPNTEPVTCESCTLELLAAYEVCGDDQACSLEANKVYRDCVRELDYCALPPPPDF